MTPTSLEPARNRIDPATTVGSVRLTVTDLARSRSFYERAIGLHARERDDGALELGAPGGPVLVELDGDSRARPLDRRATGLFHLALLFPDRRELAVAAARLARLRWPLTGASDHLVSEALYLRDPDGHGIELYRDRPRPEWPYRDGHLLMDTLPLDLGDLLLELDRSRLSTELPERAPAATRMGHIHLQVAELRESEDFYQGLLGFDVVVRHYPGDLFVSAGGYHHHLGLNTWNSARSAPAPPGAVRMSSYDILLPGSAARDEVLGRLDAAGLPLDEHPDGGVLTHDPSGNGVRLRVA